jgi:hypothetical protein
MGGAANGGQATHSAESVWVGIYLDQLTVGAVFQVVEPFFENGYR